MWRSLFGWWGLLALTGVAAAQDGGFEASWYDPAQPYLKIDVVEDGIHRVTGQELSQAGVPLAMLDPATFRLLEKGREVPLHYDGGAASMDAADALFFVGRRNRGTDEVWAYDGNPDDQSSSYFSLYSDTTTYWLTWGGAPGLRYALQPNMPLPGTPHTTTRDTLHLEQDVFYHASEDAGNPFYTRSEGYYWQRLQVRREERAAFTFDVPLANPVRAAGETATVTVHTNNETSNFRQVIPGLRLDVQGTPEIVEYDTLRWSGFRFHDFTQEVAQDRLPADANLQVQLAFVEPNADVTNTLLDWIEVAYTRSLAAQGGLLKFYPPERGDQSFVMSGFAGAEVLVLAPETAAAFAVTATGGSATVHYAGAAPGAVWAAEAAALRTPPAMRMDTPSDWANPGLAYDYVIITAAVLDASAQAQAAYRASVAGGGYRVAVVDVQDLFDQFDYGRPTPLAIRRFLQSAQQWAVPPTFLMLWGDALYPNRSRPRLPWEVPTFGSAASDGWFAMQDDGDRDLTEWLAIGRIPVRTNAQGQTFLDKLTTYEAAPFESWQKRATFVVGGTSLNEKQRLRGHALDWSATVAEAPNGLDTLHYFKSTSEVLDPTFKDSLRATLQVGTSWLTYFGHSATQSWEVVTDPPREFDNAGRLPIVLSLGCFTGDFGIGDGDESDILTFSEQLVFESVNGGIAHWGASASGFITQSAELSDFVHEQVFADTVRTLGVAFQQAKAAFDAANPVLNFSDIKHLLQYGLIGDPATRISLPTLPDFAVTPAQVSVSPQAPLPADSALTVTVQPANFGLVPADSVTVELVQFAPDGSPRTFAQRVPPFGLETTAVFTVPIGDASVGEHRFVVTVDPAGAYAEVSRFNNTAERTQVVFSDGLSQVTPLAFALFDEAAPTLEVSLATANAEGMPVRFQLDTAPAFTSPALVEHETTTVGLVARWQPAGLQPGTTYYWRARVDTPGSSTENWTTGSFVLRPDLSVPATGWYQQGQQFADATPSERLTFDGETWQFRTYTVEVSASSERGGGLNKGEFVVNGEIYERVGLGFGVLVLDGTSGAVKAHGSMPVYPNDFEDAAAAFDELAAVAGQVAVGDYVLTRTRHLGNREGVVTIPDSVKAIFRGLGSSAIDTLVYQDLWVMITRFGFPETTLEVVEPSGGTNEITEEGIATFSFGEGTATSSLIGPAQSWDAVHWAATLTGAQSGLQVDVLAADGATVLRAGGSTGSLDLSSLDARTHPFIRFRAAFADTLRLTTPQLDWWAATFTPVADLAFDPASLTLSADTVQEGERLTVAATLRNLSALAADTALVQYWLTDPQNQTTRLHTDTLTALGETATTQYTVATAGLRGRHQLLLDVRQPGRPEATIFNNLALTTFTVQRDEVAPAFEVLIDGERLPHDPGPVTNLQDPALPFVPLEPTIEILIEDENPYLALAGDTAVATVTLDDRRIPYEQLVVPGKRRDNRLYLRFTPDLARRDTVHTLFVRTFDASGNEAAGSPYQVHFRTQVAMGVESVYPYPNPMHNHTWFAFQLRGAEAARITEFRLRIYTVQGRLIREFDLIDDPSALEDGVLRIGWNKLRWDGTDADGDPVATGVYLYKVFIANEGEKLDARLSAGVEKVVVIR